MRCVALKIAVERAVFARPNQRVGRLREVVEPDVLVAVFLEEILRRQEKLDLFVGRGQRIPFEIFLRGHHPRNVRVAKKRNARGRKRKRVFERLCESARRLERKPVEQIDVHFRHARAAQPLRRGGVFSLRLHAVDCTLHVFVCVLYPYRSAVYADFYERLNLVLRERARVELGGKFAVVRHRKIFADERAHAFNLFDGKKIGRAAAEVYLPQFALRKPSVAPKFEFAPEVVDVFVRLRLVAADARRAPAKPAPVFAKRNVDVERHRHIAAEGEIAQTRLVGVGRKVRRGRIRSVAGPRGLVFCD